jgi:hypothetical protein
MWRLHPIPRVYKFVNHSSEALYENRNGRNALGTSVSTVTRLRAMRPGIDSRQEGETTLLSLPPRPDRLWGPPKLPIQCVLGALSPEIKRPGCEADHFPESSAEINNTWSNVSTLPHVFRACYLVKSRDNFTSQSPSLLRPWSLTRWSECLLFI